LSLPFRCARTSEDREEALLGTASTVRSFLLVENTGPWGVDAVAGSRMPTAVTTLLADAPRHRVRPLMIRRHGRSTPDGLTVFAAFADARAPWVETTVLSEPAELLDLDLAALGAGRSPGLTPHSDPLFLVCTHGKHDICCAERGRPIAAELSERRPELTWEVSHIGGDRFAGNMLVLPQGLYYGRLSPAAAVGLADRHLAGQLALGHLRGRCSYPFAVQAAEIFLRRDVDETRLDALTLASSTRDGEETTARFTRDGEQWEVRVGSSHAPGEQLTCRSTRTDRATEHTLLGIAQIAPGAGRV
jgi:hypothetical protein